MRRRNVKSAPVGVVGKVLRIFEALDRSTSGLQLKEIAQETGINKSTAYRFLAHLEREGYLFRDDNSNYLIGPKLVRLGSASTFQTALCKMSRGILEEVWSKTGETVNLAVLDGQSILYLDVLESTNTFRLVSRIGMRRPLYCTALGKAILANLPVDQREEILASADFEPLTPRTITTIGPFRKALDRIYDLGYALDDEEAVLGARCIGAPIFDADAKAIGGISISGPITRIPQAKIESLGTIVRQAAQSISNRLGRQESAPEKQNKARERKTSRKPATKKQSKKRAAIK